MFPRTALLKDVVYNVELLTDRPMADVVKRRIRTLDDGIQLDSRDPKCRPLLWRVGEVFIYICAENVEPKSVF